MTPHTLEDVAYKHMREAINNAQRFDMERILAAIADALISIAATLQQSQRDAANRVAAERDYV